MYDDCYQILDPQGQLVGEAIPEGLTSEDLISLYTWMSTVRLFDRRMVNLQRQGRIAFYGPIQGQEGAVVGAGYALGDQDWVFPALREQGIAFMQGLTFFDYICQLMGNESDHCKGRQMPCHPTFREGRYVSMSSVIATQVPHAVGAAMAAQYRGDDAAVLGFFGDGATSEGDFHAAANFAGVFKAPVVLFCQNNHWAITVPVSKQMRNTRIVDKGLAYGLRSVRIDGNDALAVFETTRDALGRARAGEGPTLIEAVTYRMLGHTTSDDPNSYRDPAEVEPWKARDPIDRMRLYLDREGHWGEESQQEMETRVRAEIDDAIRRAEEVGPPLPATLFEDVFETIPSHLIDQGGPYV